MAIQSSEEKQKSLSGDKLLRFFGDSRNFQERLILRAGPLLVLSCKASLGFRVFTCLRGSLLWIR